MMMQMNASMTCYRIPMIVTQPTHFFASSKGSIMAHVFGPEVDMLFTTLMKASNVFQTIESNI